MHSVLRPAGHPPDCLCSLSGGQVQTIHAIHPDSDPTLHLISDGLATHLHHIGKLVEFHLAPESAVMLQNLGGIEELGPWGTLS